MNYSKNNKKSFSIPKFLIICILPIILFLGFSMYSSYTYSNNMNEFYSAFNKNDFDTSIDIMNTKCKTNILKNNKLNEDLNLYFTGVVNKVVKSIESNTISDKDGISILTEIKKYDILNSSLDKLISSLDSKDIYSSSNNDSLVDNTTNNSSLSKNDNLALGIASFENKNYSTAIFYFSKIPQSSSNDFNIAKDYILNCQKNYKSDLLSESEKLIANKYYTDAIAFLSSYDTTILKSNDIDLSNKIESIEMFRDEYNEHIQSYPNDATTYASNAILESIDVNNVNTLNIDSKTNYFVYLNLSNQTTYIYEGALNNWKLVKSFLSSTGLPGKETPKGIFAINGRDKWFFSSEFQQGAKYWVRFMGDYLFHSVPFDEKQTTILDKTLGVAASHGCVRLAVDDSKWIYDNIKDETKVIIN